MIKQLIACAVAASISVLVMPDLASAHGSGSGMI